MSAISVLEKEYAELSIDYGLTSKRATELRLNGSKIDDRTAEIAIRRKNLFDKIQMVEQAAIDADPDYYDYILTAVTNGYTYKDIKYSFDFPFESDAFYARRRKFFWLLSKSR